MCVMHTCFVAKSRQGVPFTVPCQLLIAQTTPNPMTYATRSQMIMCLISHFIYY